VEYNGKTYHTGQGNNMFIFPGIGYGAAMCGAQSVTEPMFYEGARRLALQVKKEELDKGMVYPSLAGIRSITAQVARGVCEVAERDGLCTVETPKAGWLKHLQTNMWWPHYEEYV